MTELINENHYFINHIMILPLEKNYRSYILLIRHHLLILMEFKI